MRSLKGVIGRSGYKGSIYWQTNRPLNYLFWFNSLIICLCFSSHSLIPERMYVCCCCLNLSQFALSISNSTALISSWTVCRIFLNDRFVVSKHAFCPLTTHHQCTPPVLNSTLTFGWTSSLLISISTTAFGLLCFTFFPEICEANSLHPLQTVAKIIPCPDASFCQTTKRHCYRLYFLQI